MKARTREAEPVVAPEHHLETAQFIMLVNELQFVFESVSRSDMPNVVQESSQPNKNLLPIGQGSWQRGLSSSIFGFLMMALSNPFRVIVIVNCCDHHLGNMQSAKRVLQTSL